MSSAGFEMMRHSPMYKAWCEVAPVPDAFPALMDKTGDLLRQPYDWTEEVKTLKIPTQLVYGDSDSIPASHAAEFYALLGGGLKDPGWDGSDKTAMRLAILPSHTHYDVFYAPRLAQVVADFIS
jgi:pimeloyl-ACP methyl ester carboxylesterase